MKSTVEVKKIYCSPGHDFQGRHGKGRENHGIEVREKVELVAGKGLVGDRFFDHKEDYKGQVTFFDWAVYEAVKEKFDLSDLDASAFRRNVVTVDMDLNSLIGKQFSLAGIDFEGTEEAKPCYWMDEACAPGGEGFLRGSGGLRCRILTDGELTLGTKPFAMV